MNKQTHHTSGVSSADFVELGSDDSFVMPDFLEGKADIKKTPKTNRRKVSSERKRLERQRRHEQKELSIAEKIQEEWRLPRKKLGPVHFLTMSVVVLALAFAAGEGVYSEYFDSRGDGMVAAAFAGMPDVSEEPISNQSKMDYKVPRAEPRYIRIASLGVDARVQNVGQDDNGQVAVADNIFDAAWFNESARPNDKGAVVINGHVSGPSQDGIFAKVSRLKTGDIIVIERGDTTKFSYEVQKVETVRLEDVDSNKLFQVIGGADQGLNLITCSGQYDRNAESYSDRTIVYTTLLKKI
ncbi:class F sortase [Candidatus Saccharibacteria bacterium]|nr:class F sortase [Candidatus Saccharibacteria bacterium]